MSVGTQWSNSYRHFIGRSIGWGDLSRSKQGVCKAWCRQGGPASICSNKLLERAFMLSGPDNLYPVLEGRKPLKGQASDLFFQISPSRCIAGVIWGTERVNYFVFYLFVSYWQCSKRVVCYPINPENCNRKVAEFGALYWHTVLSCQGWITGEQKHAWAAREGKWWCYPMISIVWWHCIHWCE